MQTPYFDKSKVYEKIIVGVLPQGSGLPEEAVNFAAVHALGTGAVAATYAQQGGRVFYIAMPCSAMASNLSFYTPLAAALPGHRDHRGDGAYLLEMDGVIAAIVKKGGALDLVVNSSAIVRSLVDGLDLPVFEADGFEPTELIALDVLRKRESDKLASVVSKIAMWTGGFSAIFLVAASIASGFFEPTIAEKREMEAEKMLQQSLKPQPIFDHVSGLQKVASVTARAGGWIKSYKFEKNKVTWVIELPEWVTKDYIDELGPGAKADLIAGKNLIKVVKQ